MTLEEVLRQYVHLPHVNAKGWNTCVHLVCDHGNKGSRAAFLFNDDVTVFHCYNCGMKTKYDPSSHKTMPPNMMKILDDFGIPDSDWQQIVFGNLTLQTKKSSTFQADQIKIEPMVLPTPEDFYFLRDADEEDVWATKAKKYLKNERGIHWADYPFMLSHKSEDMLMRKWYKRLIIPMYNRKNELVFYQGRDLTGKAQKKYQSPPATASKILYGFDKLFDYTNTAPLYVTEGWFDAFLIDGVALLGNTISEEQAIWLGKSKREKVYIPDRFGNGKGAALHALSLGWSITTPDIGSDESCKDVTDIVNKFGKLYTMKTLAERTTSSEFAAKVQLGWYCKK